MKMTSSEAPMVQVENQLIRFTPATPFDPEKAVQELTEFIMEIVDGELQFVPLRLELL